MLAVADRIDARYYEPCALKPLAPKKWRSQRQKAIWRSKTAHGKRGCDRRGTPKGDMEEQNGGRHNPTAGAVKSGELSAAYDLFLRICG